MDAALAVALSAYVAACAVPTGMALLRLLGASTTLRSFERPVLAAASGLGVQAYALTLLGFAGGFASPVVLATPGALALATLPFARALRAGRPPAPKPTSLQWGAVVLASLVGVAVFVSDLAPPSDYDGLLYHLVAPRAFLERGAVTYIPHNFSANLPALGEMLFAVGLAGGSDRAPQLIHAVAGVLAVAVTFCAARRLISDRGAFWAALAFGATPLVPFLMTRAYIDLFTVLFATLAVWALVVWLEEPCAGLLALCGVALGLAVATKYAALTAAAGAALVIVVVAGRRGGLLSAARAAALTGFAAFLTSLPWFGRQTIVLGNPVWPMYLGGRDWDATRVEQLTYFVSQYGSGASAWDWLLLPFNIFRESWRFGHVPWSFPPPLAIAAPLALLDRRAVVRALVVVAGSATLLWARGWQDLRFLLTVYPVLAMLGAIGLFAALPRRWAEYVVACVVLGTLATTTSREAQRAATRLPVVLGSESPDLFLTREVAPHAAITYLNAHATDGDSVLFLGAGQVWYCRVRCIPDPAHDNLLEFFLDGEPASRLDVDAALARLRAERVGYVLLSKVDFWYLEHQDPEARLKRQLAEFYVFKARHLDLAYEDASVEVYRLR